MIISLLLLVTVLGGQISSLTFDELYEQYGTGSIAGTYKTATELETFMSMLEAESLVQKIPIGKTYEGREIPGYLIGSSQSDSIVLINGGHHARELTSIAMAVYTTLKLVHSNENQLAVIVIPVVNMDGFVRISDLYHVTGFHPVRKNRHVYPE